MIRDQWSVQKFKAGGEAIR